MKDNNFLSNYYVTTIFTLLAIINIFGAWGTWQYRFIFILFNFIVGVVSEYLINKNLKNKFFNIYKAIFALILLIFDLIWIMLSILI
ncbi:asparagine N-glycosylation enzyme membrane subunit Stt3 [Lactobacillus colini]|uniref:Asparagine N-glycosylation enzyme membrane subunit Stt3 n=1 Tax=Lactobacillus colini TaxID=1819254 RepID=A0ABS4MFH8_9LACO|nr:hypothetical protein [Lactobacillus colini]MBP2058447.1 asparagine N-glycosylation enzyme membrane subunit Stt3 [Lactobacillus colini]